MGGIMKKLMGPLEVGGGALSEYFFPGNPIGMSFIGQGLGQTFGQGGPLASLLGQNPNIPAAAPTPRQNLSAAPIGGGPEIPQSANTGISTFTPGAGPSAGAGAGPVGADMSSYANMIASNMMTNNPFAIYGG